MSFPTEVVGYGVDNAYKYKDSVKVARHEGTVELRAKLRELLMGKLSIYTDTAHLGRCLFEFRNADEPYASAKSISSAFGEFLRGEKSLAPKLQGLLERNAVDRINRIGWDKDRVDDWIYELAKTITAIKATDTLDGPVAADHPLALVYLSHDIHFELSEADVANWVTHPFRDLVGHALGYCQFPPVDLPSISVAFPHIDSAVFWIWSIGILGYQAMGQTYQGIDWNNWPDIRQPTPAYIAEIDEYCSSLSETLQEQVSVFLRPKRRSCVPTAFFRYSIADEALLVALPWLGMQSQMVSWQHLGNSWDVDLNSCLALDSEACDRGVEFVRGHLLGIPVTRNHARLLMSHVQGGDGKRRSEIWDAMVAMIPNGKTSP